MTTIKLYANSEYSPTRTVKKRVQDDANHLAKRIQHPASDSHDRTEVATGVGVAGAGTTVAYRQGKAFYQFNNAKKLQTLSHETSKVTRMVKEPISKIGKLLNKFKINKKGFVDDIFKFCEKFKNTKFIGTILNNKIAKIGAGAIGGLAAFAVLISGLSDIANVTTETVSGEFNKAA